MIRSIYASAAGMLASELAESSVAANIANVDTAGYKSVDPVLTAFDPLFLSRVSAGQAVPLGAVGSGAAVDATPLDWTAGPAQASGNPLAAAIVGPGFFGVQTAQGLRFTRAGDFHLDALGRLVSAGGDPVLGTGGVPLRAPQGWAAGTAQLTADGRLVVGGLTVGRLALFRPPLAALQPAGGGLYALVPGAGVSAPAAATLRPGFVEGSNVDLVGQMAALLQLEQAYAADQQAVLTADRTVTAAISTVGAVP